MELPNLFLTAFWLAFSGAMMPGPMLTVTINESMKRGKMAGPLIVLGHAILELVLVTGMIFGLNLIISNQSVTAGISIVGGGFLLWMGWDMIKSVFSGSVSLHLDAEGTGNKLGPVLSGIMTSLSNPYWSLWWATVGLSF
ncbi:MAG TPA: LysE family transporter, partial [Desulfobacteria bacterium]|nr:LysE family transporter [Desulfobacteria bacterium]